MKYILILFCITLFNNLYSQNIMHFGFEGGYCQNKFVRIGIMGGKNKLLFKYGMDIDQSRNTKGEEFTTINWNENPKDVYEEGRYINYNNIGINYFILPSLSAGFNVGFGKEIAYRNCFDNFHILGEDGNYYKQIETGKKTKNFMIDLYYFMPKESIFRGLININYGNKTGFGGSLGAIFSVPYFKN